MIGLLIDLIVGILISFILMLIGQYLMETTAFVSILTTPHEISIGLSELQLINQTYGNNLQIQNVIYQAQSNITAIVNSQISGTTRAINKLSYIYDLFHNLSSIKDFLEIFAIPLIIIIISIITIIYIYKYI